MYWPLELEASPDQNCIAEALEGRLNIASCQEFLTRTPALDLVRSLKAFLLTGSIY